MGQSEVSYELAHKLFRYDPIDGILIRKVTVSSRALAGYKIRAVNTAGYVVVRFEDKLQYAHRIIWLMHYGEWPDQDIDHIDGIPSNNILANLRAVTRSQNLLNKSVDSGTYWSHRDKVWVASIQVGGTKKHIGQHKIKAIAERMYRMEKLKHLP